VSGVWGGGAEIVLDQAMRSAIKLGYSVWLAAPEGEVLDRLRTTCSRGFALPLVPTRRTRDIHRLASMVTGWIRTTYALRRIIGRNDPAIVYANSGVAAIACAAACRLSRRPLIWHQHDIVPERLINRLVLATAATLCARIVAVSEPVAGSLVRLGIRRSTIAVVHNSVRPEFFDVLPDKLEARRGLGLPEDRPIVAIAGRLVPYKGHLLFLDAVAALSSGGLDVVGVVAGSTPEYAPPDVDPFPGYEFEIHRRADREDLAGRIVFTGQQADSRPILAAADVVVVPLRDEPFPLIVLEGMAAGVPVIASDSGGHSEAVESEDSGLLFETGNLSALVEALRRILTDKSLQAKLGAGGRTRSLEDFSPARFEHNLALVLDQVLKGPGVPSAQAVM
jgi:glycosyltransferase involved in cell wall biosynthesis